MNDIEFAQRLINLLTDKELQDAVKKASAKGFMVPGYKNSWKASKMQIVSAMKAKIKGGRKGCWLLIEAVATFQNEDDKSGIINVKRLAESWIGKKNDLEEDIIVKDLITLEESFVINKVALKEREQGIASETVEILKKQIIELQNKNKQQQSTIRSNKIQMGNLEKENNHLLKSNERLTRISGERDNIIREIKEVLQEQKQSIEIKDEIIQNLKQEIHVLQKYKDRAPKILCFYKGDSRDIELSGFNITCTKELNEEQQNCIENREYDKIWLIIKKFSFDEISKIKCLAGAKVIEFYSLSKLKETLGEQNGLKR